MNYYELIYLKKEFNNKLTNCVIEQAITPFKNLLELYMSNEQESFRLIFSCSPGNIALFLDIYRPEKKSNKLSWDCNVLVDRLVTELTSHFDKSEVKTEAK